jgi:holin-like protein
MKAATGLASCVALFAALDAIGARVGLPLPAGLMGALVWTAVLLARPAALPSVRVGADLLLRYLGLLFVPAAVLSLRQRTAFLPALAPLALVIIVSTTVGLVTTGWCVERLSRAQPYDDPTGDDDTPSPHEEEAGT